VVVQVWTRGASSGLLQAQSVCIAGRGRPGDDLAGRLVTVIGQAFGAAFVSGLFGEWQA